MPDQEKPIDKQVVRPLDKQMVSDGIRGGHTHENPKPTTQPPKIRVAPPTPPSKDKK